MIFTHDTELNLRFLQVLCNTAAGASETGADELATDHDLDTLLTAWKFSGRRDHDVRELRDVRATRDNIRAIWSSPHDDIVTWINDVLANAQAVPRLVNHDGLGWHIHATSSETPLAQRILVEVAISLIDVIRGGQLDRLRECEADDCTGVLVDLSKNGSKRFCSVRCGNRMAVRAYRKRALEL